MISVDMEPMNRQLKVSSLYPEFIYNELLVILILESLVKYSGFNPPVSLSNGLNELCSIKIIELKENVFEVIVGDVKVYSKLYTFAGLYICITLESNQFNLYL